MFTRSIRWRLQLWLGFLLVIVLSGFGVAVYQLQRVSQFSHLDEELAHRVAALSAAVRSPPPFGPPGRRPFDGRPGPESPGEEPRGPPPPRGGLDSPRPRGPRDMRFGPREFQPREFRIPTEVSSLFDETRTNGYYFAVWSRDDMLLKRSTNAPFDMPI